MILKITEAEARFMMARISSATIPTSGLEGLEGLEGGESVGESLGESIGQEPILEQLDPQISQALSVKLIDALRKSDALIERQLTKTIQTLEESGFDTLQVAALVGVRDKAKLHQEKKYDGDEKK